MTTLPPAIVDNTVTAMPSWITAANTYYGYCKIADVQLQFLDEANMPSSAANSNVVAQCITETAMELQTTLEAVYQMPYVGTDPVLLATLSEFNAKLAAANIYDRIFSGNEPSKSTVAAELRAYVEMRLLGVINGEEQWGAPFHDAVPQGDKPAYPHSALAQGLPSGSTGDVYSDSPIFTMGRLGYRKPIM